MADLFRAEGVDCRRRGKDRRAREESGELRTELTTGPALRGIVGRDEGGLQSYGPTFIQSHGDAAAHVVKILNGVRPADLPVEQPTTFELLVNLKSAQTLRLTIPESVLQQATEVIQYRPSHGSLDT